MKKTFYLFPIFISFVLATLSGGSLYAAIINVPADYSTISAAVAAASPGDDIVVAPGTYSERVTITKSLTLKGVNESTCILDGTGLPGTGSGITISSGVTNVTIKYFTVRKYAGTNPNSSAGIYAVGGNNNLTIEYVTIENNSGGSGFYANGPVTNVTLDHITAFGHDNSKGVARGIVIWNGLKSNITITNCKVYNNNCCGIELQDGSATGVTISNNLIYDNGDNGIGVVGAQGPSANVISNNTLTNNGRFGIEIKNPNGYTTVSGNTVTRSVPIGTEVRDIAGIAVMRRGLLSGNVDVPTGVTVTGNTVSGYVQPSDSEGFGIVIGGTNHIVTSNTVTGNDVGIQQQAGHTPYPGDGDQSNSLDTYFGRDNSPITCGNTISGNDVATRDVGGPFGNGFVANITKGGTFCSIQAAINDANPGDTLAISPGTYTENVDATAKAITFAPGASPGCVTIVGDLTLDSNDVLAIEIEGATACTGYDQFSVTGTVTLGNALLSLTLDYTPSGSDLFTIIDGSNPIVGTFSQSSSITVPGAVFNITYSGNDVVLQRKCGNVCVGPVTRIGNATLSTQAQVDAFVNGSGCKYTFITGNLIINGSHATDPITNLCNLSELQTVGGSLTIRRFTNSNNPTNLSDLGKLKTIGGSLTIGGSVLNSNTSFAAIDLPQLEKVEGNISITRNTGVTSINIPTPFVGTTARLLVQNNSADSLAVVVGVKEVTGNVAIQSNGTSLSTLSLPELQKVGRHLDMNNTNASNDVSATAAVSLPKLTETGGRFRVVRGANTLSAPMLTHVGTDTTLNSAGRAFTLQFGGNGIVSMDDAVPALAYVGGSLVVSNNPDLGQCCVIPCQLTHINGVNGPFNPAPNANPTGVTISNNKPYVSGGRCINRTGPNTSGFNVAKEACVPETFTVTVSEDACPGAIQLGGSQAGVVYQLWAFDNLINNYVNTGIYQIGDGNPLTFDSITLGGSYQVIAVLAGGCEGVMDTVSVSPGFALMVDAPETVTCGDMIEVCVRVGCGISDLASLQIALQWDKAVFEYVAGSLDTVHALPGPSSTLFVGDSVLRYSWFDLDTDGEDLEQGDTILCFKLKVLTSSGSSEITFVEAEPGDMTAIQTNFEEFNIPIDSTAVMIQPIEVTCPADTIPVCLNADMLDLATLEGFDPTDGEFLGPGVDDNMFDPDGDDTGLGSYTITYIATNSETGCVGSCDFVITVNALPAITCPSDTTLCSSDDPLVFGCDDLVNRGMSPSLTEAYFYDGEPICDFDPNEYNAGQYEIIYVVTNDSTGCSNTCTFTITVVRVIDSLSVTVDPSGDVCVGATGVSYTANVFGGTGPFTYAWCAYGNKTGSGSCVGGFSPGGNNMMQTRNWPSLGPKSVRVTVSQEGCPDQSTLYAFDVVADPMAPVIAKDPNKATVCAGSMLKVTPTPGSGGTGDCADEYRYSTDDGATWSDWSTDIPYFEAVAGINRVQSRRDCDGLGCNSNTNEVSWMVDSLPDVSISLDMEVICAGEEIKLSFEDKAATGHTFGITATLSDANGDTSVIFSGVVNGAMATYTEGMDFNGSATLSGIEVTDDTTGCKIAAPDLEVMVNALPETACQDTSLCQNDDPIVWCAEPPSPELIEVYKYMGDTICLFNPADSLPGDYTITYIATNSETGCVDSCDFTITVKVAPAAAIGPVSGSPFTSVCVGQTASFLASPPADGSPEVESYKWTFSGMPTATGAGQIANDGTKRRQEVVYNSGGAGPQTVNLTVEYENGCIVTVDTHNIMVNALPEPMCPEEPVGVCIGGSVQLPEIMPEGGDYSGTGVSDSGLFDTASGDQTITYTVTDENGCVNSCDFDVVVNDLPEIACPTSFSVCVDADTLDLTDLGDNAPDPTGGTFSGSGVAANQFDPATAGVGAKTITYTVTDSNGCANSCTFTITVNPCITLSGRLIWRGDGSTGVSGGNVTLSGDATDSDVSDVNGDYELTAPMGGSFVITPSKGSGWDGAGISAADVTALQQHLTGANVITDFYRLVASDVNRSDIVSTLDASILNQAILGSATARAIISNNGVWRFVSTGYPVPNPAGPFQLPPFGDYNKRNVTTPVSVSGQDFYAVKAGDVNNDLMYSPKPDPSVLPLVWQASDRRLVAGELVEVEFAAIDFDQIAAFQHGLRFEPNVLRYVGIEIISNTLNLDPDQHFGAYQAEMGELRASWAAATAHTLNGRTPVFRLRFEALVGDVWLSEVISLDADILPAEAYSEDLNMRGVALQFVADQTSVTLQTPDGATVRLLQNRPNPFAAATAIGFELPEACEAQLRVYDMTGRLLTHIRRDYVAGYHEELVELGREVQSGVLMYELQTPFGVISRKMVLLK